MPRAAAFLLIAATLLAACSRERTLTAGQTVTGVLSRNDPKLEEDGSYYQVYTYRARANERVTVTLRSTDFDAYLAMGRGARCEDPCVMDDDGAGGTDARLRMAIYRAGTYTIRVNTLSRGETGRYTLQVASEAAPPVPKVSRGQVPLDQPITGSLGSDDPLLYDDSYYEDWTFRPDFTGNVLVTLRSTDFDTYLAMGQGLGLDFQEARSDDDSGGGTDSRLAMEVVAGREYTLRANALNDGETGTYQLMVSRAPQADAGDGGGAQSRRDPARTPDPETGPSI